MIKDHRHIEQITIEQITKVATKSPFISYIENRFLGPKIALSNMVGLIVFPVYNMTWVSFFMNIGAFLKSDYELGECYLPVKGTIGTLFIRMVKVFLSVSIHLLK